MKAAGEVEINCGVNTETLGASGRPLRPRTQISASRVPASLFRNKRGVRSRASRGALVAQLMAGTWRNEPEPPIVSADELDEIAPLLLRSGAAGLAWRRIRDYSLRACSAARQLQQAYRIYSLEAALHERRLKHVIAVMRSFGAEPVLVKGWAIARLHREPGLRPYCDLDLCVLPDHYAAARAALRSPETGGGTVDLHPGFGKFYERQADQIFARSQLVSLGNLEVRVLGPEDNLRFLSLHLLRHGAVRPLWLADIAVLLESRTNDFDWDRCLSGSRRQADWVACAIGLAHHLLGADVRGIPVETRAAHLPSWLVSPVLKAWGTPCETPRQVASFLRHPISLSRELLRHWPNPIEATMTVEGSFNEVPRLPYQLRHVLSRAKALFSQLWAAPEETLNRRN